MSSLRRSSIYWYEVQNLWDIRRFCTQKQPDISGSYDWLAKEWLKLLDSGEESIEAYTKIGKEKFWQ